MGASRKLQGEIDRVLKRVQEGVDVFDSIWNKVYDTDNANQKEKFEADLKKEIKKLQRYRDQIKTWIQSSEIKDKKALMDARKLIEREMERFKICEKETKTKAFSKEGLVQQPKTDPKEKAKGETRDWLNNVVSELENQIDSFEAEIEGLTVKKGKTRPPRLTHLETSIVRHKAHIDKLIWILRLLDNDQLSPEQVNDVKDFLDDFVERNQEDFDDFSDVDELYSSLPLDIVESLEDVVAIAPPGLVKVVNASNAALSLKNHMATSAPQAPPQLVSSNQPGASAVEQVEETASQESSSDIIARSPPPKSGGTGSVPQTPSESLGTPGANLALSHASASNSVREEDGPSLPGCKASPTHAEGVLRGVGHDSLSNQLSDTVSVSSTVTVSSIGALGATSVSAMPKRNIFGGEERLGSSGMVQPLVSPMANRMTLPQVPKAGDGIRLADAGNGGESGSMAGRMFSSSAVPGVQWRPGSSFQNQNEVGQFRGRTEIAPDQREKFLQRLQQVQQQQNNPLGIPLSGHKPFSTQQQNPLLQQQFNSQSSSASPQLGLGVGVQPAGLNSSVTSSASLQQQPISIHQLSNQQTSIVSGSENIHLKFEEFQKHSFAEDSHDSAPTSSLGKNSMHGDEMKSSYALDASTGPAGSGNLSESSQTTPRDTDFYPGQPLQSSQSSGSLGVIGRRSVADLGAIGDNFSASANFGEMYDHQSNLQILDAAFRKLPPQSDSERAKSYTPRHPVKTPASYTHVQAPIVNNPAFWERLGSDNFGTDTLFFAFYYQQNTYQQYMAARELKKQSWRYHRMYNSWFKRHEEPKHSTDDFELGTYIYFDFYIGNDEHIGWIQRVKTDFTFEYSYLEDELVV